MMPEETLNHVAVASPAYLDPSLPAEVRAEDLLAWMTLAEKIGQMTLPEINSVQLDDIGPLGIGGVLSGGGGVPGNNTVAGWIEMVAELQAAALESRLGIPLIYGVDAVHGHNNLKDATIFPHNIGLGATGDADLLRRIGRATALEMAATGVRWNYAPVLAVPQDPRWGRYYESFGDDTELVTRLSSAYLRGMQDAGDGDLANPAAVLGTPKHYIGDGATTWGTSRMEMLGVTFRIDQGDAEIDEATLRAIYLPPYEQAIKDGALSVMASFSSWNGDKLHGHHYLLTEVLKEELGFDGFIVTDWQAIDQLDQDFYQAVVKAVNAGIDMNMVPYDYRRFIATLTAAVEDGAVPMERIDDAVRRILRVKFALGLFETPMPEGIDPAVVRSAEHLALAREAVQKSLVLLKNEGEVLPLSRNTPVILVAGRAAEDIGLQSGGWTIKWQGNAGDITAGTTILEGIRVAAGAGTAVHFDGSGHFDELSGSGKAGVGIVVLAESPYAEGLGDRADLHLPETDIVLIERMRERVGQVVVILLSGRPLIITEQLPLADAWVAAWLPGSEGRGVADVLFGAAPFSGRLSYPWPRAMDDIPLNKTGAEPLFARGFGLTTGR